MFEYDINNDEYNEVFLSDDENVIEQGSTISVHSFKSYRSRRQSIRSNVYIPNLFRIVSKSGRINLFQVKVPKKYLVYFRDFGNTLLNTRWRWIMTTLCLVNFISFGLFGLVFMGIAYISGDFEKNSTDKCIENTKNLTGYILLSIETMLTIGYGYRYPTEKCVHVWTVPFLQALVSIGIQGALVSAVYVKITKPFTRNHFGLFTKKAVVCLRDSHFCLIVRVADLTGKISVGTKISMYFIDKEHIEESSSNLHMEEMEIEPYGFPLFPLEIVHVITSKSPFWKITPYELLAKSFELVVVAEGMSTVTGQISQNRTSYVNSDIFWGHRFNSCVNFDDDKMKYVINCKSIDKISPIDTPLCSAEVLNRIKNIKDRLSKRYNTL